MLFTQPVFAAFLLLVLFLHRKVFTGLRQRKVLLLVASYVFYGWWDLRFLLLLWFATLVNFAIGRLIDDSGEPGRDHWRTVSVVLNLGVLGVYKYFDFFAVSARSAFSQLGMHLSDLTLHLTLPVAISFFTFEAISYTVDVHRRTLPAERDLLDFALFVGFFPRLVAGPIVRPAQFLPQLRHQPALDTLPWRLIVQQFLVGFIKKAVIADTISAAVDRMWASPNSYRPSSILFGVLLYSLQIYCDFSGYSDMAISTARMFGYELPPNFDRPYSSATIDEFWRRWHISLSSWLRDYLYIPLGGNRRGSRRTYRNLMLTMLLGGLWHGASWTFVVWGGLHGGALAVSRMWKSIRRKWVGQPTVLPARVAVPVSTAATFVFVSFCWIFFRAPTFSSAWTVLGRILAPADDGVQSIDGRMWAYVALAVIGHVITSHDLSARRLAALSADVWALGVGCVAAVAIAFMPVGSAPFIYFQF